MNVLGPVLWGRDIKDLARRVFEAYTAEDNVLNEVSRSELIKSAGFLFAETLPEGHENVRRAWFSAIAGIPECPIDIRYSIANLHVCILSGTTGKPPSECPTSSTGLGIMSLADVNTNLCAAVVDGREVVALLGDVLSQCHQVKLIDRYFFTRNYEDDEVATNQFLSRLPKGCRIDVVSAEPESRTCWSDRLIVPNGVHLVWHKSSGASQFRLHDRAIWIHFGHVQRRYFLGSGPGGWRPGRKVTMGRLRPETFNVWWEESVLHTEKTPMTPALAAP